MAKYSIEDSTLTAIANAIREKGGTTAGLDPEGEMPAAILALKGAEVEEVVNTAGGKSVYINAEAPKLPEGFTRLKWIQSTGTQHINTEYTPNSNTRVVLDAYNLSESSGWTFGAWSNSSSLQYAFSCNASYSFRYGSASAALSTVPVGPVSVDFNKNAYNLNGTAGTLTASTFACAYPMYLFAINAAGAASSGKFTGRINFCQIYDDDVLVRDYVPCLNASNVAGLYDMVNGVFYGDAAGGAFVAGPVVLEYELPEGYEELEYIQSSGSQYVLSGVPASNKIGFHVDFETTSAVATSGYGSIFGAWQSGSNRFTLGTYPDKTGGHFCYGGNVYDPGITAGKRIQISLSGNTLTTPNGTQTVSGTFTVGASFVIFARVSTGSTVDEKSKTKLYRLSFTEDGVLVRYYVPCRNASGVVGLWDAVNNTFTGDAAGVGFVAGPGKGVSKVVLEDRTLIDLTGDTISPETVLAGFIGHDKTGAQFVGELVQKAGGRPFAFGTIALSYTTSATVSGLSFSPKIVFLTYNNEGGVLSRNTMTVLADGENGFRTMDYGVYDSDALGTVYRRSGGTRNVNMSTTATGFTITATSANFGGTYRWYAIG